MEGTRGENDWCRWIPRWIGVPRDGMDMGICRIEIGRIAMDEEIGGERFATERASNQVRRQPLDSKGARAEVDVQQPPGGSVEAPPVHHSYITHPWPMACSSFRSFEPEGDPRRELQSDDLLLAETSYPHDEAAQAVPVGHDEEGAANIECGQEHLLEVGYGSLSGHRKALTVRGRDIVGPSPDVDLVLTPASAGGTLVKSLKITIHPFIQSPCHVNWQGVILRIGTEVRPRMPLHFPLRGDPSRHAPIGSFCEGDQRRLQCPEQRGHVHHRRRFAILRPASRASSMPARDNASTQPVNRLAIPHRAATG